MVLAPMATADKSIVPHLALTSLIMIWAGSFVVSNRPSSVNSRMRRVKPLAHLALMTAALSKMASAPTSLSGTFLTRVTCRTGLADSRCQGCLFRDAMSV